MGVYINMEMPKSCAFCRFAGAYCYAKGDEDAHSTLPCPLIPVPPHGDLIDRDVLLDEQVPATLFPCGLDGKLEVHTNAVAVGDIMYAPTVIPASKERK